MKKKEQTEQELLEQILKNDLGLDDQEVIDLLIGKINQGSKSNTKE